MTSPNGDSAMRRLWRRVSGAPPPELVEDSRDDELVRRSDRAARQLEALQERVEVIRRR